MKSYTYRIIIEKDGKAFHGYVPSLPGCHTYGATIEKTRAHLREAMSLYLAHMKKKRTAIPEESGLESFETVMVGSPVHA